ncbi:MAG: Lysophospholipase 1 [Sclerophora amabilis]|nr:MAG: Lysophospholipase 1 [Sclerophora amabilis]
MKVSLTCLELLITACALVSSCQGSTLWSREARTVAEPKAYRPSKVDCPSERPVIRRASKLSSQESAWLKSRHKKKVKPMQEFLQRMNISDFDASKYIDRIRDDTSALPNIALAFSGGGYRAMLNGAGVLSAFDSRSDNTTNTGQLGGLLQSSTYISGLSGGSWLVGSIYLNDFATVSGLQKEDEGSVWELGRSIIRGPDRDDTWFDMTATYGEIRDGVKAKDDAGFNTTATDYWALALSYQLFKKTRAGYNTAFSSLADDAQFAAGEKPMPFIVADGRAPGQKLIPGNATNYEFNPWEMGSFDPTLFAFAPLRYLGSAFSSGELPEDQSCITGFDNAAYIMGTSSSLFNAFLLKLDDLDVPKAFQKILGPVLKKFSDSENDIANYTPNPFYLFNKGTNKIAEEKTMTLVDGGLDLQNIPLNPLIQPQRSVDVIFAIDSSADTDYNWPDGSSLMASYQRSFMDIENGTTFPAIPDNSTFINSGLNTRPTFFGCDSKNMTGPAPIIVYIPHYPYVYHSNVSTFDAQHTNAERDRIIWNGHEVATRANGTQDEQWPTCVGCVIISRSLERTKTDVPPDCQECFKRYCWDGKTNSTSPPLYDPPFVSRKGIEKPGFFQQVKKFFTWWPGI